MYVRLRQIFDVAVGALNTVAACEAAGGARRLFDEMHREPEGPTARRYRALEFATEQLRHPAPDPRATEVDPKDWPLLRALVLQVIVGLLASGCALLILRAMGSEAEPSEFGVGRQQKGARRAQALARRRRLDGEKDLPEN